MDYLFPLSKHIHVWCVTLSFFLFVTRFAWLLRGTEHLNNKWVKITPHIIDTVLLVSGVTMALLLSNFSTMPYWFAVKLMCVLAYIGCGIVCFKAQVARRLTGSLALAFFFATAYLAITKPV